MVAGQHWMSKHYYKDQFYWPTPDVDTVLKQDWAWSVAPST
jgi:hypothetical protein